MGGGHLQGQFIQYYENGKERVKAYYDNDKLTGPYESFYESGKTKNKGVYLGNLKQGLWYYYYPEGETIPYMSRDIDNKIIG
jgi:antitoxin component YwqK of YwqJK toxin-antitoxin module